MRIPREEGEKKKTTARQMIMKGIRHFLHLASFALFFFAALLLPFKTQTPNHTRTRRNAKDKLLG